ncbi:alpha/beta hydrolase [Aquipuribacter hungaricus]|uniref:Alpha/beta hydrolase n=2 Tax=Aquipuribacter hungaricus TaxID=545624 RepID=A0ABV7WFD8_9MICO
MLRRRSVLVSSVVVVGALVLPTSAATARPDPQARRAVAAPATAAPAAAAEVAEVAEVPEIAWGTCSVPDLQEYLDWLEEVTGEPAELPAGYECALFPVPLDHAEPDGPTLDLALVRRPADDPAARQGTIFFNPGGPGGSGFETVLFGGDFLLDPAVTAEYDLVGFDPRGIARSAGLDCATSLQQAGGYYPFMWPESREDMRVVQRANKAVDRDCRDDQALRDSMSTTDVADDLELMRQAVGDEQLNFFGVSYGSYVGAVYANRYPQHAGAIVVDAVIDPVAWATGRDGDRRPVAARVGSDVGAQQTLEEFFRLCEESGPDLCAFAGDSRTRFAALHATLQADPVVLAEEGFEPFVIDHQLLTAITLGSLYSSFGWSFLAEDLVLLELLASGPPLPEEPEGPGEPGADALGRLRALAAEVVVPDYVGSLAQTTGVMCADGVQPRRAAAWEAAADSSAGYFGPAWAWTDGPCAAWDVDTTGVYRGPFDRTTATPLLVMNTTFDPATPYAGALALHADMPGSRLVTVEGWGHATIGLSLCAEAVRTAYFLTRQVPAQDVTCQQDLPVFVELEEPGPGDGPGEEPGEEDGTLVDPQSRARVQAAEATLDPALAALVRQRETVMQHVGRPAGAGAPVG